MLYISWRNSLPGGFVKGMLSNGLCFGGGGGGGMFSRFFTCGLCSIGGNLPILMC